MRNAHRPALRPGHLCADTQSAGGSLASGRSPYFGDTRLAKLPHSRCARAVHRGASQLSIASWNASVGEHVHVMLVLWCGWLCSACTWWIPRASIRQTPAYSSTLLNNNGSGLWGSIENCCPHPLTFALWCEAAIAQVTTSGTAAFEGGDSTPVWARCGARRVLWTLALCRASKPASNLC